MPLTDCDALALRGQHYPSNVAAIALATRYRVNHMITRNTLPRFARSVEGRDAYAKGWEARAERYLVESKVFGLSNEQRQQMVANAQAARFQAQRWRGIGRFVKGLKQRKAA